MDSQPPAKGPEDRTESTPHTDSDRESSGTQSSDIPTSSSQVNFFPGPGTRGLPLEVRLMVYDRVVGPEIRWVGLRWIGSERRYRIYVVDNSSALALLRNGHVWENDASSALEVRRATEAITFRVNWTSLDKPEPLLELLKDIDAGYAMDQMQHRASSTALRKWAALVHSFYDNVPELSPRLPWYEKHKLTQAIILQLRRKPEIKLQIDLRPLPTECFVLDDGDPKEAWLRRHVKALLTQLGDGMTVSRTPRSTPEWIRHRVVLVTRECELEHWKVGLGSVERDIEWATNTKDDWRSD